MTNNEALKALIEYADALIETHDMTFDQVLAAAEKNKRGGKRNPPGGRPKKAPKDRKVKINITLSTGMMEWIESQREPGEPLSNTIERLLQSLTA